ncbi:MAG TPA: pirin family protein [Mariprofundaceae bacterium]|nr:pirin family protein [Mariprofundaceae bacterium]
MITLQQAMKVPEGAGVTVQRLMPVDGLLNLDPFVLWDHFSIDNGAGFPDHPHRGFEAITYIFSGGMHHADNLGNASTVTSGGAQRFTAGRGLVHSEKPVPGEITAGIQLWINLPRRLKSIAPDYQQVNADQFPEKIIPGGTLRTIVGRGSPLKLHTDVLYLELELGEGSEWKQAIPDGMRGLAYAVEGNLDINGHTIRQGDACLIDKQDKLTASALETSRAMLCFGRPHHEPIRQYGPFVD